MPELKPISKDAIPGALEKARHYRLLNQPWQAESICSDILRAEPDNQQVIYELVLTITDQFEGKFKRSVSNALEVAEKLTNTYQREYCSGLIYERQAMAAFKRQTPRAGYIAFNYLEQALYHYGNALKIRPSTNDEAILRWNACVRFINQYKLKSAPEESGSPTFLDV